MNADQLTTTLVSISSKLAVIDAMLQDVRQNIKEHRQEAKVLDQKLDQVEQELAQTRGAVKTLKWVAGLALASPAAVFAIFRIFINV